MAILQPVDGVTIYLGDVRETLRLIPDRSVQCVVTSPPYWRLRDYETATWEGGDPGCDHLGEPVRTLAAVNVNTGSGGIDRKNGEARQFFDEVCEKCGARRVDRQLGLEATLEEYVGNLVAVFRELRRVLRPDGVVWLNVGDCFVKTKRNWKPPAGLKKKDLVGMPWRVALALQADGWYLRSDVIWSKPNPLPESVQDRPTRAHEYVFLLSKAARYYYDAVAIMEPVTQIRRPGRGNGFARKGKYTTHILPGHDTATHRERAEDLAPRLLRNRRSVWSIPPRKFDGAHFATFPPALVRPCILAGSSPRACPVCAAPWRRAVAVEYVNPGNRTTNGPRSMGRRHETAGFAVRLEKRVETTGWVPTCSCPGNDGSGRCIVLDPFHGSGTVMQVALEEWRHYAGCELNPAYVDLSIRERLNGLQVRVQE